MTRYGYPDLKIEIDDGGTLQDISQYVTSINGVDVDQLLEELTAAGDSYPRWGEVGLTQLKEITLAGPYDDDANGPDLLKIGTGEKSFKVTVGSTNALTVEVLRKSFKWTMTRGEITGYEAVLQPTGTITIA